MYFNRFLKGIAAANDFDDRTAMQVLLHDGIRSNWLRNGAGADPADWAAQLTEENLLWHLSRYEVVKPGSSAPFGQETPFISTTAGTVRRDVAQEENVRLSAFLTALSFATHQFQQDEGYIFYGYLLTLGRQAVPLIEYAEEVRDLHIYTEWLEFQEEGEVAAKILIPSLRLQRVERWSYAEYCDQIDDYLCGVRLDPPQPQWVHENPKFAPPEDYVNIREVL